MGFSECHKGTHSVTLHSYEANQFSVSFVRQMTNTFFNTMPGHLACMNVQIPFTGFPIFFLVKPLRGSRERELGRREIHSQQEADIKI